MTQELLQRQGIGTNRLSLLDKLKGGRRRLIYSVIAIVITTVLSIIFVGRILRFFVSLAPSGTQFIALDITEMLDLYMRLCLYTGITLAMPFLIYQVVLLINPVLPQKLKVSLYAILPLIFLFFLAGIFYSNYVLVPVGIKYVLGYGAMISNVITAIDIRSYVAFMAKLFFIIGLIFEFPMIMFILTKFGVVSHQWLARKYKWFILGALIIAALITPTGNIFRDSAKDFWLMDCGLSVSGPLLVLYFLSILMAWLARKPKKTLPIVT